MVKTKIEWTDETWNPVRGCAKVSHGCDNCYAMRQAHRFSGNGQPYEGLTRILNGRPQWTGKVRCVPEALDAPLRWRKPRMIFVNSMSDLFHDDVPDGFIDQIFAVMAAAERHTFQVLTKRPARMMQYFTRIRRYEHHDGGVFHLSPDDVIVGRGHWPLRNVWLGVSIEDQSTADERIPPLLDTTAAVRFLSCEPLIGPINLSAGMLWLKQFPVEPNIHWVIAGGESGPKARPSHPDWFRSLRDQCQAAGVPFFFKQWGEWKPVCAQYPSTDSEHYETEQAGCAGDIALEPNGVIAEGYQPQSNRTWLLDKVGKKAAGRELDGRTWDEYPQIHFPDASSA